MENEKQTQLKKELEARQKRDAQKRFADLIAEAVSGQVAVHFSKIADAFGILAEQVSKFEGAINEAKNPPLQKIEGEVTIGNPVKEVTIKNPVSEVAIKNVSEIGAEGVKAVDSLHDTMRVLLHTISRLESQEHAKNTEQLDYLKKFLVGVLEKQSEQAIPFLSHLQFLSDDPKKPLSVRLSDGERFYKSIANAVLSAGDASNNKLDELKAILQQIEDNTDGLEITADSINLNTDTLEAKVQSVRDQLNVLLSTRASEATLIQVRDYLDTVETKLQSVIDNTDGVEGLLTSIRDYVDTLEIKLQTLIDERGKDNEQIETRDGKAFSAATNLVAIVGTGETDFYLLKNPTGSGKKLRLLLFTGNIEGGGVGQVSNFRIYKNPTITTNGTALTIVNKDFTSSTATVMQAFSAPTISARGTLLDVRTAASPTDFSFDLILGEGHSVLVSVDATLNNTLHSATAVWVEE